MVVGCSPSKPQALDGHNANEASVNRYLIGASPIKVPSSTWAATLYRVRSNYDAVQLCGRKDRGNNHSVEGVASWLYAFDCLLRQPRPSPKAQRSTSSAPTDRSRDESSPAQPCINSQAARYVLTG